MGAFALHIGERSEEMAVLHQVSTGWWCIVVRSASQVYSAFSAADCATVVAIDALDEDPLRDNRELST